MFKDKLNLRLIGLLWFSLWVLFGCESATNKPADYAAQKQHFVISIAQTQQAGRLLQQAVKNPQGIEKAMLLLDNTMPHAYALNESFLKWLDQGLYHAYSAFLIKGIESYRLGVEGLDKEQQAKGVKLLQRWWSYWQQNEAKINEKLKS